MTKIRLKELNKYTLDENCIKIIHTSSVVSDEETPLAAIKNSKHTSMWNCIQSQVGRNSDISLAGNTGVLLIISRMILKMMDEVSMTGLLLIRMV